LRLRVSLHGRLLLLMLCSPAINAQEPSLQLGGALAWTSDYVFHGVSQSDNQPALQGNMHIEPWSQWTFGAWGSTVRLLPDERSTELDFYLTKQWTINQNFGAEFGITHYSYANDPRPYSYAYNEISASVNWLDTWSIRASWSPDTTLFAAAYGVKKNQPTATFEANYHHALPYGAEFGAGVGYYVPLEQHEGNYGFGNAGLGRTFGRLRAELNWFWTQRSAQRIYTYGPAGGPWTLTMIWAFGGG